MAEDRELLEGIRRALEDVKRILSAIGFVWGSYAYILWLVPLSLTVVVSGLALAKGVIAEWVTAAIWVVSIVVITSLLARAFRWLSGLRSLRLASVEISRRYARIVVAGWAACWLWLLAPLLHLPMPKSLAWPLSFLAAITTGVTVNAVLELRYYRCWVSAIAAAILYGDIALLLAAPVASPWNVVCGGVFLSYATAIALYIHYALKLIASTGR